MPVKIGFQVIASTGEDEKFRANELNYHGPTVRGWRSSPNCGYPQEIILQLKVSTILQQIQILAHQYLIAQKIEICTSNKLDYHSPSHNPADLFEYLGFITFSDNRATGFRSRELKSILIPSKKAKYIKLRIHSNYENAKNLFNQVGLMAVNVLGDEIHHEDEDGELNNNFWFNTNNASFSSTMACNSHYVSPYDDLAFEMYVDQETARIIKVIEVKKLQAVFDERFDLANTLKIALENLRVAGEILGLYEQEKKQAIRFEDFDKAKVKKLQIDNFRQKVYTALHIDQLLDSTDILRDDDVNFNTGDQAESGKEDISAQLRKCSNNNNQHAISDSVVNTNYDLSDGEEQFGCDKSPTRKYEKAPQSNSSPQIIHSKSQIFLEDKRNLAPSALFKSQTFSTSTSNPQLHLYLHEAHSRSLTHSSPVVNESPSFNKNSDVVEQLEDIRTPSSTSSFSGPLSPTASYYKLDITRNLNDPTERQKDVELSESIVGKHESFALPKNFRNWNEIVPVKSPLENSLAKNSRKIPVSEQLKGPTKTSNVATKSSFEAYEDRMLPALKSYHGNEIVRECQLAFESSRKSTLNEREKKQAVLPISVFGIEMIEKFYSKSFSDKEEGLKQLQQELKRFADSIEESAGGKQPPYNKIARGAIFLLHRTLRDKVYSVYSCAAETVRLFFMEFVPQRVSSSEVARSVEKLLPELLTKSGDVTPRIHNLAAHTLLSMAECEEVRRLNIIPAHLSRPITSSVHPRLALSRLEMVEQLILSHGISKDKRSGLTCRTLAEFGSSGLHHPAEAVRKVSERILIEVYKVNPRIVRKQLPPDDNVTRRNLLYRQLLQEFDFMDLQRKLSEQTLNDTTARTKDITTPPQHPTNHKAKIIESINQESYSINDDQEDAKTKSINTENWSLLTKSKKSLIPLNTREKDKVISLAEQDVRNSPINNSVRLPHKVGECTRLERDNFYVKGDKVKKFDDKNDKIENGYTSTLSIVNRRNNESGTVTLKFPSLTDSIVATKARMLFDQKKNLTLKKVENIPRKEATKSVLPNNERRLNNGSISRKEIKRDTSNHSLSSIPVPTFGSRRKYSPNSSKKFEKPNFSSNMVHEVANGSIQGKNTKNKGLLSWKEKKMIEMSKQTKLQNLQHNGDVRNGKISLENNIEKMGAPCKRQITDERKKYADVLAALKDSEYPGSRASRGEVPGTSKMCIFCLSSKKWTTEDGLNDHYLKDCPMLTMCKFCTEVIEISGFTNHLLSDCNEKQLFQKCNNCQEAILKDFYSSHECAASANKIQKSRCPFCHTDIADDGNWRSHLMGTNVCPNHPRRSKSAFLL